MRPRPVREPSNENRGRRMLAPRPAGAARRTGWAVRHTLIAIAALSVLAVGLHWWRTRSRPSATTVPPAMRFRSGSGTIASLVYSRKGHELYVAASGVVEVYDPATGRRIRTWSSRLDWITHLALSEDGRVAMTAGYQFATGTMGGAITLWSLSESADPPPAIATIATTGSYPSASALSPDGAHLAYALQTTGGVTAPNSIRVFDVSSESEKFTCTGHTSTVGSLAFSPDGGTLVSASWDNSVRKWDLATGGQSASWAGTLTGTTTAFFGMGGEQLTYSSDGGRVAVAGAGNGFEIRDAVSGSVHATGTVQADSVQAIAFSPDGTLLAAAGNTYSQSTGFPFGVFGMGGSTEGAAGIWDAATGKLLVWMQQNGPGIQSLAFSPDGKRIAVGDQNGTISIWNVDEVLRGDQR